MSVSLAYNTSRIRSLSEEFSTLNDNDLIIYVFNKKPNDLIEYVKLNIGYFANTNNVNNKFDEYINITHN